MKILRVWRCLQVEKGLQWSYNWRHLTRLDVLEQQNLCFYPKINLSDTSPVKTKKRNFIRTEHFCSIHKNPNIWQKPNNLTANWHLLTSRAQFYSPSTGRMTYGTVPVMSRSSTVPRNSAIPNLNINFFYFSFCSLFLVGLQGSNWEISASTNNSQ